MERTLIYDSINFDELKDVLGGTDDKFIGCIITNGQCTTSGSGGNNSTCGTDDDDDDDDDDQPITPKDPNK